MVPYDELQVQKAEQVKELSKEQTWQLCHPVKEGSGLEVEMSPPVETLLQWWWEGWWRWKSRMSHPRVVSAAKERQPLCLISVQ